VAKGSTAIGLTSCLGASHPGARTAGEEVWSSSAFSFCDTNTSCLARHIHACCECCRTGPVTHNGFFPPGRMLHRPPIRPVPLWELRLACTGHTDDGGAFEGSLFLISSFPLHRHRGIRVNPAPAPHGCRLQRGRLPPMHATKPSRSHPWQFLHLDKSDAGKVCIVHIMVWGGG
jgi:hypothetical protein